VSLKISITPTKTFITFDENAVAYIRLDRRRLNVAQTWSSNERCLSAKCRTTFVAWLSRHTRPTSVRSLTRRSGMRLLFIAINVFIKVYYFCRLTHLYDALMFSQNCGHCCLIFLATASAADRQAVPRLSVWQYQLSGITLPAMAVGHDMSESPAILINAREYSWQYVNHARWEQIYISSVAFLSLSISSQVWQIVIAKCVFVTLQPVANPNSVPECTHVTVTVQYS